MMNKKTEEKAQRSRNNIVFELSHYDVLLGRGAGSINYVGNVLFRETVRERREEYLSTARRQVKDSIARQIVDIVTSRNGRFLRKITTSEEKAAIGIREDVNAWVIADEEKMLEKVKQSLRDREYVPDHKGNSGPQDDSCPVSETNESQNSLITGQFRPQPNTSQSHVASLYDAYSDETTSLHLQNGVANQDSHYLEHHSSTAPFNNHTDSNFFPDWNGHGVRHTPDYYLQSRLNSSIIPYQQQHQFDASSTMRNPTWHRDAHSIMSQANFFQPQHLQNAISGQMIQYNRIGTASQPGEDYFNMIPSSSEILGISQMWDESSYAEVEKDVVSPIMKRKKSDVNDSAQVKKRKRY
jgi:hypothetical protein